MEYIRKLREEKARREADRTGDECPTSAGKGSSALPCTAPSAVTALDTTSPGFAFAPLALDRFKVGPIDHIFYAPLFLSQTQEQCLLQRIHSHEELQWVQLKARRLICLDDLFTAPDWVSALVQGLLDTDIWKCPLGPPNHILVNEYQPGEGIMHHTDGPSYWSQVIILSLESATMMTFREKVVSSQVGVGGSEKEVKLYLEPRSLLVFDAEAYRDHMHGIYEQTEDFLTQDVANLQSASGEVGQVSTDVVRPRGRRVSITIRRKIS